MRVFSIFQKSRVYGEKKTSSATTVVTFEQTSSYHLFIGVIFLLAVLGLIMNDMLVLALVFFFLLFLFINRLYLAQLVKKIAWSLDMEHEKIFPDDENKLTISIENKGFFPILKGEMRVKIDAFENSIHVLQNGDWADPFEPLEDTFQLWGKKRLKMDYHLLALKRGTANVSNFEIKVYDIFQLSYMKIFSQTHLRPQCIVYPSLEASVKELNNQPEGNAATPKPFSLNEDTLIRGSRQYHVGDSLNRIHWKLTAKNNELQTKEFEKINNPKWTIVINLNEAEQNLFIIEELEAILSQAAYMCKLATSKNIPYELFINQRVAKTPVGMHLGEGSGNRQLSKAFERLSKIRKSTTTTPIEVSIKHLKINQFQHPYILHFGHVTNEIMKLYTLMERQGTSLQRVPLPTERIND